MEQAPSPYDEHPYYGRFADDRAHAPFMIVRSLMQLGLADWTATLLDWLGRYDGLEQHLGHGWSDPDPRLDPVMGVRDALIGQVLRWPALDDQPLTPQQRRLRQNAVIEALLELDFVGARAFLGGQKRTAWNPLFDDWLSFIELAPDLAARLLLPERADGEGLLHTWISPDAPDKQAIRALLRGQPCTGDI